MATSIALNIITGRTGTAHVSSDDDAAIWRGLVGNNNITLYTDQQLALDYQTKGRLSLSDGVFCIAGKMGRVSNASYVEYGLPLPGSCRRTFLLVRYAIDNDDIESMNLLTLQSEDATGSDSAAIAAELPIAINTGTDYVLYDFVCDEDGVVSGTMKTKMPVMGTVSDLGNRVNLLETWKEELNPRVTALENGALVHRHYYLQRVQLQQSQIDWLSPISLLHSIRKEDILFIVLDGKVTLIADLRTCTSGSSVTENTITNGDYSIKIRLQNTQNEGDVNLSIGNGAIHRTFLTRTYTDVYKDARLGHELINIDTLYVSSEGYNPQITAYILRQF